MNQKFCPLLTAAVIKAPEKKKLVAVSNDQPADTGYDAVPCAGAACAFYTPVVRAGGKQIDGHCALYLFPTAISMLNDTIRTIATGPASSEPTTTN